MTTSTSTALHSFTSYTHACLWHTHAATVWYSEQFFGVRPLTTLLLNTAIASKLRLTSKALTSKLRFGI
jgi:hypothetical protein